MSDTVDRDFDELFPDDDQIRADSDQKDELHRPDVGRLVEPESGVDEQDITAEAVASDIGSDDGDLAPEERAMHIVEEEGRPHS